MTMHIVLIRSGIIPDWVGRFEGEMTERETAYNLLIPFEGVHGGSVHMGAEIEDGRVLSAELGDFEAIVFHPETPYDPQEPLWLLYAYSDAAGSHWEFSTDPEAARRWLYEPFEDMEPEDWHVNEWMNQAWAEDGAAFAWVLPVEGVAVCAR